MKLLLALLGTAMLVNSTWALHSDVSSPLTEQDATKTNKGLFSNAKVIDNRNVFSPRMDYDEWTPLGRGDPLKNDPTYDYVPPVLERVHYWMDPSKRTPDPPLPNSGVLILGSSRTEPTITSRLTTPKYQTLHTEEPQADSRIDTMSLLDPFFKFMDASKINLNLSPSTSYYRPTVSSNRVPTNYPRPVLQNVKPRVPPQALQRPPYTMLMPPPPPPSTTNPTQYLTSFAPSTTTTEADKNGASQFATLSPASSPLTVQTTTTTTKPNSDSNLTTITPTVIANTENVYKPVAIVLPEPSKIHPNASKIDTNMGIKNKVPIPDDNSMVLPIISMFNSHKKDIAKEESTEHGHDISEFQISQSPDKHVHLDHLHHHHYPSNGNDVEKDENFSVVHANGGAHDFQENTVKAPHTEENTNSGNQYYAKRPWNYAESYQTTTMRPKSTTNTMSSLTTDPMFKHYKQPSKPLRGPFYLIIQGHSKVKTYGASKNPINGFVSSNEIKDDDDDRKTNSNEYYDFENTDIEEKRSRQSKKLKFEYVPEPGAISDKDNADIVKGHPTLELSASFKAKEGSKSPLTAGFSVGSEKPLDHLESLEEIAFGKTSGGSSKKRYLNNDLINVTSFRNKREVNFFGRKLLNSETSVSFIEDNETTSTPSIKVTSSDSNIETSSVKILEAASGATPTNALVEGATPIYTASKYKKRKNSTTKPVQEGDDLNLESFIAINDDYNAEDVINYLLREEGQGSGFGNFVASIFSRSNKDEEKEI